MKLSLDWSIPNKQTAGDLGLFAVLWDSDGGGVCGLRTEQSEERGWSQHLHIRTPLT
jgi:hypothetical protein